MASLMPICAGFVGPKSENVKISSALIRPKWAYKQQTHIFPHILPVQRRPRYDEKGKRRDKGAIGAKKGLQKRLYLTVFEVEKVNFLVQNASYRSLELCFLLRQGAHVCKNRENIWPKSEKCRRKTLDGEFDAYMCGPGGAKKRKC